MDRQAHVQRRSVSLLPAAALCGLCHTSRASAACRDVLANNPFWIGGPPGGTQVSGWLAAWTPAPSVYADGFTRVQAS
jgi:hypothetical protein